MIIGGAGIQLSEEEFPIVDRITIRVGDHGIAYIEVFTGALQKNRPGFVVPLAIAIVGVDMVFSRIPLSIRHVNPSLQRDRNRFVLIGDGKGPAVDPVFGTMIDANLIFPEREFKRDLSLCIEMTDRASQTVECSRRKMEVTADSLDRNAGRHRISGVSIDELEFEFPGWFSVVDVRDWDGTLEPGFKVADSQLGAPFEIVGPKQLASGLVDRDAVVVSVTGSESFSSSQQVVEGQTPEIVVA